MSNSNRNGWRVIDPHSPFWLTLADESEPEPPPHHPTPTYRTTRTITHTVGKYTVVRTQTVYTNRKPANTNQEDNS